jgi:hypothetical protein
MEDPVKGVSSPEFIGPCHINADIALVATESRPDLPSTLAERDGRAPNFSQQETGPAEQAVDQLDGESVSVGKSTAFPKRSFHRHKVLPQGGDEAVLVLCPVRTTPIEAVVGTRQGCIEDGAPSVNGTHGMDHYFVVILFHIHSHLPGLHLTPKPTATAWNESA